MERGGRSLGPRPFHPSLSRRSYPASLQARGGGAAAAVAPASPVEESRQRLGCLVLGWFYLCCQGRWGGEQRALLGSGSWCHSLTMVPDVPVTRLCPLPSPARPEAPKPSPVQPAGVVRDSPPRGLAQSEGDWRAL